ncbi:MAG: type I restriction-modification system subunit M [Eubacteriaceae bacterium]|nr:type I restriction-modification system subunit M [Eubacteriaceae bacterium]
MNKQQLASKIWESANKMRSKIEANEYKDYILGFIFYKFLCDKQYKYLKANDWSEDDIKTDLHEDEHEIVQSIRKNVGYFIAYENLFSTWLNMGKEFNVSNVRDALSAFNRLISSSHKKVFEKIFDTLQTGLSKLGDTSGSQTKAISDLLHLIKDIPMDGRQDYDVLGFIYEYLISNFAANAGKKAGEFYTPQEVSLLMSEIVAGHLKDRTKIKIYDPTSGSGSLLIIIGKSVAKHMGDGDRIKYYAQELKENTFNLTRMNLIMRGILPDNIIVRCGDTLEDDWPYFDDNDPNSYDPLYVDAVVSNPPYSQSWNPANKETDPRYKDYGLAPKGKADYAFLLHDLYHVKYGGIMTIVLPHGVLFRGGEEGVIRKNLIENDHIDAIIGLPANIFFGTGIPTIIMVLKRNRKDDNILFIDASKGFEKVGKNNKLRACDIKKIADVISQRPAFIEKFARCVTREEIRENDYNLNIPRYIDSSEKPESWDIYASMFGGIPASELAELSRYWEAFPGLKEVLFDGVGGEYLFVKSENIREAITTHPSVGGFVSDFTKAFEGFEDYLYGELIDKMENVSISMEENILSENIFTRLAPIDLIDPYEAYQLLDNEWNKIAIDLEIIQTEGLEAITKVDPNMVIKKKDGKEQEVQEGWVGHILPFALVQEKLLADELAKLRDDENRLAEIISQYEQLLDELPEEEKEKEFINEDKTAFVAAEVKKAIKANEAEAEILATLKRYDALSTEEKALKKQIKKESTELHLKTKSVIENLKRGNVTALLHDKWVLPIITGMKSLPESVIGAFTAKLTALAAKYETTFSDVERQIRETQSSLCEMIDELEGSDFDLKGLAEFKKLLGGE